MRPTRTSIEFWQESLQTPTAVWGLEKGAIPAMECAVEAEKSCCPPTAVHIRFLCRQHRRFAYARCLASARENFFKSLDGARRLGVVTRTRRQLAIAHRPQLAAERLLRDDDLELIPDHWQRSTTRQRTTPCTAGIGPFSIISANAARCSSLTQLRQFDRRARAKGAEDCVFCDGSVNCGAKVGLAICE